MRIKIALLMSFWGAMALPSATIAQDVTSLYEKILSANTLDQEGKAPFHIKIAFQLYDMQGKPLDTGDVEEWWAAPGQSKIVVDVASLKTAGPVTFDEALPMDPRERFFIRRLLSSEVHPVPFLNSTNQSKLQSEPRTFGTTSLSCLSVPPNSAEGSGRSSTNFCVDPATNTLRIEFEMKVSTTTRNEVGTFHGTSVSLNTEIAFEKRLAITGKVLLLQAFDSSKTDAKLTTPALVPTSGSHITAGKIKSKFPPRYPDYLRATQQSGTVVLNAVISKDGTIKQVTPLASPGIMFTQAAVQAVKQWTYEPFLLDGQPVELDTVINVSFNYGGNR